MSSSDPTDDPTVTPKTPGFRYRLRVTTGSDWGAGTMAAITVTLIGTEGQSEPYNLIWPMYHLKAGSPGSRVTTSRSRCCCCIDGRRRRNGRRCTNGPHTPRRGRGASRPCRHLCPRGRRPPTWPSCPMEPRSRHSTGSVWQQGWLQLRPGSGCMVSVGHS
ncbi:uncharacterized protein LOC107307542 isoform X3 [Coturnix japonica]|uniref:uncharacterized protein LOC107307542 isoform X3 n=1 Tax=Coturnix japonica TaxID=93934 RepID=UPI00077704F0|nr:uncharacterized protein LOC107307542 isoform X3 [Coturnix japonica]